MIRFANNFGSALNELATIVHPGTIRRWIRDASGKKSARQNKGGRPRTAEQIEKLILKLAGQNGWGYTNVCPYPITLIGTIVKWRYPDAEIGKSVMSDAATIAADGKRTAPSSVLKTTMQTSDSVENVLAFYRDLLTRNPENCESRRNLAYALSTGWCVDRCIPGRGVCWSFIFPGHR